MPSSREDKCYKVTSCSPSTSLQMTGSSALCRTTMYTNWLSGQNHMELNLLKTVEVNVDFGTILPTLSSITILSITVSSLYLFKFRRTTMYRDLRWTSHIDSVRKKAQQRLNFLSQLGKFNLTRELLVIFCTAIIQSTLLSLSGLDWAQKTEGTDCSGLYCLQKRSQGPN